MNSALSKKRFPSSILFALLFLSSSFSLYAYADDSYVEPGTLRVSHQISLEGLYHRLRSGWNVREISSGNGREKEFYKGPSSEDGPSDFEWGTQLLTELSARFSPSVTARGLFEVQKYADRFWRPLNAEHYYDEKGNPLFIRELEARIDREQWYLHGFSGVGHGDWKEKGDFFGFYRDAIGDSDYLGSSGYFGIFPDQWKEDVFHNLSLRRVPQGFEGGLNLYGWDMTLVYGDEVV